MPLPRSLVQPFRKNTIMVGAGWRGYFAPFDIASAAATFDTSVGPTILDLAEGPFDKGRILPTGFLDTGWIKDFKLTPESKIGAVRSGYRGAIHAQFRGQVGESFEFKFREYGRLQYKIATGSNVLNLIKGTTPSTVGPVSATGATAAAVTSYDGNVTLVLGASGSFAQGDWIVCDDDYDPLTYGMVGDASTPVFPNAVTDVDYIRKNSDYVARIAAINGSTITLDQPFRGGGGLGVKAPDSTAKVQKIQGFAAREGGTYITEWTGLFLLDTIDQCQVAVYYPHISIMQNRDMAAQWAIENIGTTDMTGYELDAQYQALAFDDPLDGETVVGYKGFYPRPGQSIGY